MVKRDNKGRILPGQALNKSGRPKSAKLTQKDRNEFAKAIQDGVKDESAIKSMLIKFIERAELVSDVHKYFKEYAPFLAPKLSSVKQEIEQETIIKIQIEGFADLEMIDKSPKVKVIEAVNEENNGE